MATALDTSVYENKIVGELNRVRLYRRSEGPEPGFTVTDTLPRQSEVSPPTLLSSCTPSVLRYGVKPVMSEALLWQHVWSFAWKGICAISHGRLTVH